MANRVAVCLHAGIRASIHYPAEEILPGPCVRGWDYVFLDLDVHGHPALATFK
jgi:hypothetical protein